MLAVFKTGLEGDDRRSENLRQAARATCPTTSTTRSQISAPPSGRRSCSGEDVKERYADLKQASADRCPRLLGTVVKAQEVQFHHEVYNQYLWNLF